MSSDHPNSQYFAGFRLAILIEGAIGLAAVGVAKLCGISLSELFGTTPRALVDGMTVGAIATLPMLLLFWWVLESPWRPFAELRVTVRAMVRELFPRARLADLAIIAALAGVSEELLFRGVIQTGVALWTSSLVGLVVASLIFGGLHAISRTYFALAALIGVYLGWLLVATGDLTVPIVAHGLYDFVALIYLTRTHDTENPI